MGIIKNIFKKKSVLKKQDTKAKKDRKVEDIGKQEEKSDIKKSDKPVSAKIKINKEDTKDAHKILVKPLLTEKATDMGGLNQYLFAVSTKANKIEVKKAIKSVYGVEPIRVNIMNVSGKKVKWGKVNGRTNDWKKAIIYLRPEDKIEITEGV